MSLIDSNGAGKCSWRTYKDNSIIVGGPTGERLDLRIVWDEESHVDVAYVCPTDGENGNVNAELISLAPVMFQLGRHALYLIRKHGLKCEDSSTLIRAWSVVCDRLACDWKSPIEWHSAVAESVDAWTFDRGGASEDKRCVRMYVDLSHELGAAACRKLAAFLLRAAYWIEQGNGLR